MRHAGFAILVLETGRVEQRHFTAEHFKEAGIASSIAGMPLLEAHELVNRWNRTQAGTNRRFVYWLE